MHATSRPSSTRSPQQHTAHRRRAWRISVALFVCFCVVTAALHTVLQDFEWWFALAGIVFAVLATAAITRAVSARRWLPTLVASLVLGGITTFFFAREAAFLFVVPTPETFRNLGVLAREGGSSIAGQSVPAEATLGVVFLLCLGAGALAIVADLIAVTWRRPALAALPLATILGIPTMVGNQLADVFMVVLAGVCWLVLLRTTDPYAQTGRALGVGALAVAFALFAPLVLPHVDEPETHGEGFGGHLASVNPMLALGSELRRTIPRMILTASTVSGDPTYLRLVSLQNFQPETWVPDPPAIDPDNLPSAVGDPPGLAADVVVAQESTRVEVSNLGSPWLPVPYPATGVSGLRGDWYWDAEDLTFSSPDRAAKGEKYWVSSLSVRPTPAQLEAASGAATANLNGVANRYRELPDDLPTIIGDTAREVTASAPNDYARAVALQGYFRGGTFDYSETAPVENGYDSNGMTAIAQFLDAKSGYCIHFASAMAVMARTLDIPSRVTVGFLPGERLVDTGQGAATFRVSTQDVHSWPELYFEGIGWTRFEPTPGRGVVPSYADEATPGVPFTPNLNPTPTPSSAPTAAPTRPTEEVGQSEETPGLGAVATLRGWLWAGLVGLGIVVLLLSPAIVRAVQRGVRMRRFARGHPAATTLWRELLQSVDDLGVDISDTATPRETAAVIAHAGRLGESGQAALDLVLALVERQSFAGESPTPVSLRVANETGAGKEWDGRLNGILDRLRSASGWRVRVRAVIAPRSIWSRLATRGA